MIVKCHNCKKPKDIDDVDSCLNCQGYTCFDCGANSEFLVSCCDSIQTEEIKEKPVKRKNPKDVEPLENE